MVKNTTLMRLINRYGKACQKLGEADRLVEEATTSGYTRLVETLIDFQRSRQLAVETALARIKEAVK